LSTPGAEASGMETLLSFVRGAVLSGSLFIAIGAQTAFVLRVGLQRRHVLAAVLVCAVCDAALVVCGVAGAGAVMTRIPGLVTAITIGGALYLVVFGVNALRRAVKGSSGLAVDGAAQTTAARVMLTALALTLLNPSVYIDTLVLIGGIGARDPQTLAFALGAMSASFAWYFSLGFGARLLTPFFAKPGAWRLLDTAIGLLVLAIAAFLSRAVRDAL
jgi:L-lysine exporter family protein LysE/ArgO